MTQKRFQSPKGTRDVLPEEQPYWSRIESVMADMAGIYGYEKLDLPVFEDTALFQRGVGETTDIVEKEMYTFPDKSEQSLTLRPEFTAGVIRAFLQNGMTSRPRPVKLWSTGPIFRYERPQAGRFRQFTQFNVEALGELDPALDFEIMSLAWQFYETLGFKNLNFQINSIGCPHCRPGYLDRLAGYYEKKQDQICDDCRSRIKKNPLRLLDCKKESCQSVIQGAPAITDFLCLECKEHFSILRRYLDETRRSYTINSRMVRGLDYYTKTVFEVWAEGIGAQNAVCGGGRYDGLVEILGGPSTPGIGFAAGIERIVMTMKHQDIPVPDASSPVVYIASQGNKAASRAVQLLNIFRNHSVRAIMGFGGRSFKAQFREADRRNVHYVAMIGEDEIAGNTVTLKSMKDGHQETVTWDQCIAVCAAWKDLP